MNIGGQNNPIIMADFCLKKEINLDSLLALGYRYSSQLDKWSISDTACDYVFVGDNDINFEAPSTLGIIYNYKKWKLNKKGYPFLSGNEYLNNSDLSKKFSPSLNH